MLASATANAGGLERRNLAASFCNAQPNPHSSRKAATMPAEIEAVMTRSSEAASAKPNSARPLAAAAAMKRERRPFAARR